MSEDFHEVERIFDQPRKREAPATWLAKVMPMWRGEKRVPGVRCQAVKRDGTPCRKHAVKGGKRCDVHGGWWELHRRNATIPRCKVSCVGHNVRKRQCSFPAMMGSRWDRKPHPEGLCTYHAGQRARGVNLRAVPSFQRIAFMAPKPVRSKRLHRSSLVHGERGLDQTADAELIRLEVWRIARGPKERAFLAQAWAQRETSPALWRKAVRDVMESQNHD